MFIESYDPWEGLITKYLWLDKLLCKLFGHPPRRYYTFFGSEAEQAFCARCLKAFPRRNGEK